METQIHRHVRVLWDYMHMNMPLEKADYIVGFGCYNREIPLRAAELYHAGWAPRILFTGGLGRNTRKMWQESEAECYRKIALSQGVPEAAITLETRSSNTGENIRFTRAILEPLGVRTIIGIHKPFMERRLSAAMGVFWPEVRCLVTSPQLSIEEYIRLSEQQGISRRRVIEILVGDVHRVQVYPALGYQLPQVIPPEVLASFEALKALGYTAELVP